MQCAALALAACCVFHPAFVPCLRYATLQLFPVPFSSLVSPFPVSFQFPFRLSSIFFLSLSGLFQKEMLRDVAHRAAFLSFRFWTDGVGQALLCMRGLMAFRLPGDSLQWPPEFHSPAFCRLYICSTLSASTGLSVVMKLIPQLVISAIVGISLTVHTLVVIPLARATFGQAGLLR